jgi:hypothetical protein
VVSYGFETRSFNLKEGHILRIFEEKVFGKVFGELK